VPDSLATRKAKTLRLAAKIMGGEDEAKRWMAKHVMGLSGQRPVDLLRSAEGAQMVRDFLMRLEYGVYT
jgi:putative toxin-antitoxin system antitoxin component (TIGR02293 family)